MGFEWPAKVLEGFGVTSQVKLSKKVILSNEANRMGKDMGGWTCRLNEVVLQTSILLIKVVKFAM